MVVLSSSIISQRGDIVLSRQYVDIKRNYIEDLLSAFIGMFLHRQQNTIIDKGEVRYMYQQIEDVYLLFITNRSSNVIEDSSALQELCQVVCGICDIVNEESVRHMAFEIIFAFDEVFSPVGVSYKVDSQQILSDLAMDSQTEKLEELIIKDKERETKKKAKEKMREIELMKRETRRKEIAIKKGHIPDTRYVKPYPVISSQERLQEPVEEGDSTLKLSRKPKTMVKIGSDDQPNLKEEKVKFNGILVRSEETVSMRSTRDGSIDLFDVSGCLNIQINSAKYVQPRISINHTEDKHISFQSHPNIDKTLFSDNNILAARETSKKFPVDQTLTILKWKVTSTSNGFIPITVNCWPEKTNNGIDVVMEYQLENKSLVIRNFDVSIPVRSDSGIDIKSIDGKYDMKNGHLHWRLDAISAQNATGTFEFAVQSINNQDSLFPVNLSFQSEDSIAGISIDGIKSVEGETYPYKFESILKTGEYALI